jgi:hypothetical protein
MIDEKKVIKRFKKKVDEDFELFKEAIKQNLKDDAVFFYNEILRAYVTWRDEYSRPYSVMGPGITGRESTTATTRHLAKERRDYAYNTVNLAEDMLKKKGWV